MSCTCGTQAACAPPEVTIGAVWQCPRCRQVWGCPRPNDGEATWIRISDQDAALPGMERHDEDEKRA